MKKGLDCVLLFVLFAVRVGCDDVTLTTAVFRDGTTPKPTAIYRRIHVDPHVEEMMPAPLDLFRLRAPELRRTRTNIWNWDDWCQLQPKSGNCSQNMIRYYYNMQTDQCLSFKYTGCQENKNNFKNLAECERYCKGAAYTESFVDIAETKNPTFCFLQPHAGLCMAMFYNYYYDVNTNTCKSFLYSGCGGNQNRFSSKHKCMSRCQQDADAVV